MRICAWLGCFSPVRWLFLWNMEVSFKGVLTAEHAEGQLGGLAPEGGL